MRSGTQSTANRGIRWEMLLRRTLAGAVVVTGSLALLALAATVGGWDGFQPGPAIEPWLLQSPLPVFWGSAIFLWTLVLVAVLVSDDRAPRPIENASSNDPQLITDTVLPVDDRSYVRLGRRRAEPVVRLVERQPDRTAERVAS